MRVGKKEVKGTFKADTWTKISDNTITTGPDSSGTNKVVAFNGNATLQAYPSGFDNSALFLNGTTDYVSVPDSADWDMGTGDFTVEGWFRFNSFPGNYEDLIHVGTWANGFGIYNSSFHGTLRGWVNGTNCVGTYTVALNTWYYIAFVRSSGTGKVYVNGVNTSGAGSDVSASIAVSDVVKIGSGANGYHSGWAKEVRISNVARSGAMPTAPYTTDANTKLLLHFDNSHLLTPCCKLDGTGDYLTTADSPDWDMGTGDYSIEMYLRFNGVASNESFISIGSHSASTAGILLIYSGGLLYLYLNNAASSTSFSWTPTTMTWHYLKVVRTSGSTIATIDGAQIGSTWVDSTNIQTSGTDGIFIGNNGSTNYFNGWMRNINITKAGVTVFNLNCDEANGVTTFIDSETTPKTVTTHGDCKITYEENYTNRQITDSETSPKTGIVCVGAAKVDGVTYFGTGTAWLDGTGDYLSSPDNADFNMATGDFTLEGFMRMGPTLTNSAVVGIGDSNKVVLMYNSDPSYGLLLYLGGDATYESVGLVVNTWYHFAATRLSGVCKIWRNGTLASSKTMATSIASAILGVGADGTGNYDAAGVIDEVRVVKGVAKYTAAFNPPSAAFTTDADTKLLLHMDMGNTTQTISGLTGNTDEEYILRARIVNGSAAGISVNLRFNNDSGANYGIQQLFGNASALSASRYTSETFINYIGNCGVGQVAQSETMIYAKSGYVRTILQSAAIFVNGTTVTYLDFNGQSWNNTTDEITSLVIFSTGSNGLGVGTNIQLWKKQEST